MRTAVLALAAFLLAACGGDPPATPPAPPPPGAGGSVSPLLDADLPGAVGVLVAKEREPEAEVTVYGRVQATAKGVFTLVDAEAVQYCGEEAGVMDACETPWDYCCESTDAVRRATLVVEAHDAQGQPVPREALGLRPLDLVVVRGTLTKDASGTLSLLARSGWFRRERPAVSDQVKFP